MLFNPDWEVETEIFTLPGLISWLETKPPDAKYDYVCNGACLLALYLTHLGFGDVNVGSRNFRVLSTGELHEIPAMFNNIALGHGGGLRTFGAALERARACAETEEKN